MFRTIIALCITFLAFSANSYCSPKTRLSLSGIPKEMQKILQEHVAKKQVTTELLQDAVIKYIEQFDPDKVYLLESEVSPFLNLSQAQKQKILAAYAQGNFSIFERLNSAIQVAIKRARSYRRALVADPQVFFDLAKKPFDEMHYATAQDALFMRHKIYLAKLVEKELYVQQKQKRKTSFHNAVRVTELEIEEFENDYLFLDRLSRPLAQKEREEFLAFHIMKALTTSLDAHSSYLDPRQAKQLRMRLEKNYVGVGLDIEELGKAFVVASIVKGSSADTTNVIQIGDELVAIDGRRIDFLTLNMVQDLLDGDSGTKVVLDLQRRGADLKKTMPLHITLERRQVELEEGRVDTSFEKTAGGIVGIIQLHSFYEGSESINSEKDMRRALKLLAKKGKIKGLILDLRDNRGGYLLQAVKVAGLFIKSGVIVAAKYSDGNVHYFRDLDPGVSYSGPLIVLISKKTASAAEIVAEALKDYGVAVIVGDEKSFGKGSIQLQTVTKEDDSYFKVTIGRYYGVSGQSTQIQGVKADVVVPGYFTTRKMGEEFLQGALEQDTIEPSFDDTLSDVAQEHYKWFQKYYIPFLQPKVDLYRKWIPQLRTLSEKRLAKNINYQRLIKGGSVIMEYKGLTTQAVSLDSLDVRRTLNRLQLEETINVMNDLIRLSF